MDPVGENSRPAKRKRLSHACNYCRLQKKRCDEGKPSCRKCIAAGQVCITTNPRRPGAPEVERSRAGCKAQDDVANSSPPASKGNEHPSHRQTVIYERSSYESSIVSRDPELAESGQNSIVEPTSPLQNHEPNIHSNAAHTTQPTPASWPTHSNLVAGPENSLYPDLHSAVNSDENYLRKKYVGASSLQVFAQWVDLVLMSHGSTERLSDGFRYGMRHAEEYDLPLSVTLPSIPPLDDVLPFLELFLDRINPLFPFVDAQFLSQTFEKFKRQSDMTHIPRADIPELAILFAVLSVGMAELNGYGDLTGKTFLDAAYSLLAHIISYPYLSSIQALGIIAISLRGRLRDGAASQLLGQAIRIAHSIGLHRGDISPTEPHAALYGRVWCACYCLEKNIQFDSGRPSEVVGDFTGLGLVPIYNPEPHYAQALLGLSQIQSRINRDIFSLKGIQRAPQDLLPILAVVDADLTTWTDSVSEIIRPGREFTICPTNMLPPVTFLALQYYSTLAMIHRTSLLVDQKVHQSVIESTSLSPTAKHRLLAGESICVNAARSIVRCVNDMLARYGPSQLLSPQAPLLAVYILVIHTMRHPHAWNVESDLNLIKKISSTTESLYSSNGQHGRFTAMCSKLHTLATMIVSKASAKSPPARKSHPNVRVVGSRRRQRSVSDAEEDPHGGGPRPFGSITISVDRRNLRHGVGTPNTHPNIWFLESPAEPISSESNNSALRHRPLNPAEYPHATESRYASREINGLAAVYNTIPSREAASTDGFVFSPNTIDRFWATTLTDNLSFPNMSHMADFNPNPYIAPSSSTGAPNASLLHAGEEEDEEGSPSLSKEQRQQYFGDGLQQPPDSSYFNTATSQPQQLLSPTATSYRDHQIDNPSWRLPEACHLLGMPLLCDLGPDLHLLHEDTAEESGLGL